MQRQIAQRREEFSWGATLLPNPHHTGQAKCFLDPISCWHISMAIKDAQNQFSRDRAFRWKFSGFAVNCAPRHPFLRCNITKTCTQSPPRRWTHHRGADRQCAITSKRRARHSRCVDQRRSCLRCGRSAHARSAGAHGLDRYLFHGGFRHKIINQIRGEDARRFKVTRSAFGETGLVVAVGNPLDIDTIDSLSFSCNASWSW